MGCKVPHEGAGRQGEERSNELLCGVEGGLFAYVGKKPGSGYHPFYRQTSFSPQDVEVSDEVFLSKADDAK